MADIKLTFNNQSFYDLRRDPGVIAALEEMGTKILDAANETLPEGVGYRMSSAQGAKKPQGRWAVHVFTSSDHAKRSDRVHNTLMRLMLGQ